MLSTWAVLAILAPVVDVTLLVRGGARTRAAVVCGVAAVALGSFVSLAAAPALATVAFLADRATRARTALLRGTWLLPVVVSAWLVAVVVTDAPIRYHQGANNVVMAGFACDVGVIAWLERRRATWARAALAVLLAGALALQLTLAKTSRDQHDLLALACAAAAVALAAPLRRRIAAASGRRLVIGVATVLAVSISVLPFVDRAAPGWRVRAWQFDRWQGRLARACRAMVDVDLDGFSPVAWGGDCNDVDAQRNPFAHERPGVIDANCNGVTPSATPTDDDRGLAPPAGDAAYTPGDVDLVLLLTIDCGRRDIVRPDVMPNASRLAQRGVVFERLYAGGSRTDTSFPLMQRTWRDAEPVTKTLGRAGVATTVAFPLRDDAFTREYVTPFETTLVPETHLGRWDAREVTDVALAHLAARKPGVPELLWVHYYDAHAPILYDDPKVTFSHDPRATPEYDRYLAAVHHVDAEMGRLVDAALAGDAPRRTVVVFTADHGEGFGNHGVWYHSVSGYEAIVHVPGFIVAPGLAPGRYRELASHRDLPATLLGFFGFSQEARDAEVFGRSWLRLRDAPDAPLHRFVVSRSARAQRELQKLMAMGILVDGNAKLIETFEDSLREMYDVAADPLETVDLVPDDPADVERLRHELALYRDIDRWP
jgi:arylsulfatase A-like enzyme